MQRLIRVLPVLSVLAPTSALAARQHTNEATLAMSAAPAFVADSADVYVLGPNGYDKVRSGTNGFACIVDRPRPQDRWPTCYDAEGVATMIPVSLYRAALRAGGVPESQVTDSITHGYAMGKFRAPRRTGIAYMLSTEGASWDATNERSVTLSPHLMFYAPYLTNADVGGKPRPEGWPSYPFVRAQGRPDAYIIVPIEYRPPQP